MFLHNPGHNRSLHCCHMFRSCLLLHLHSVLPHSLYTKNYLRHILHTRQTPRFHPKYPHNPGHNRFLHCCHMFHSCLLLHHHPMFLHNPGHNRSLDCCHMFRSCLLLHHHSVLPHNLYMKNYLHHILHTRLTPRFHPKYPHSLVCSH